MPKSLSADIKNDIKSAILAGKGSMEIANRFRVTYATVNNYANKFFPNRQRRLGGRPMVVSAQTKRFIKLQVLQGQLKTAREVHGKLMELGYYISYKTAINVLKSMNFFAAIKVKKPLLTAKHMNRRLAWAKKHQNWTTDDWRRVVLSDETKVNIWGSDGCKYYWSRPGDPLKPHYIDVTVKHGGGSLMMWGCMTYEGPGYACQIYDETMNSDLYQHILDTTLRETMEYYNMDWSTAYFQHDGDPKHRSKSTVQWLQANGVNYIDDWPAQSPDLNPIEHLWHHLKLKLSLYDKKAKGVHELWERVEKDWNSFDKEVCRRYIDTMPAHIKAVIDTKGGSTRY
ncbi:hypothetical protein RO3G_07683 [Rhizopus delemar RA 99-880]|uniref:Tc1-like transposase DDE domain-containing protein n=2 Tax=Rhizopus delemar (strain RA 99-880 / ATCC MYA-4621 / FGSC 9543 / NRRL 43880) TaxID=246409 RepID=I1C3E8_RHIO9|nr:hypothetical protein RO3G_01951 [Rhizopus delemar RA 99-880]EIE82978.1 hypothetical protein RO3G_07683 [Rhizopus delemar RA 99-880]|eukprot:EIE77247.1 hypothetical protein RO3G_01951 [Rhizopus delemar RA 99-880]